MKKVLFCTDHPAPYFDNLRNVIDFVDLKFIFYKVKSSEKEWKERYGSLTDDTLFSFKYLFKLIKIFSKSNFLILSGWGNPARFLFLLFFSKLWGKSVLAFSDHPIQTDRSNFNYLYKRFIFYFLDGILCASFSTKKYYQLKYKIALNKLIYFPYCSDQKVYNLEVKEKAVVNVLLANRFIGRKGYEVVLPVLRDIQLFGEKRVSIDILGNGPLFQLFRDEYYSIFTFHGWVEHNEYTDRLRKADIFVHASEDEPFGIPPVDAFASGAIVLVSDGVHSFSCNETNWEDLLVYKFARNDKVDFCKKLKIALENVDKKVDRSYVFNNQFGLHAYKEFKIFIDACS